MILLNENNIPMIESIYIPTISEYFWSFHLKEMDFRVVQTTGRGLRKVTDKEIVIDKGKTKK